MSLLESLKATAEPKATAKAQKSKTPVVQATGLNPTIREWRESKEMIEDLETSVKHAKRKIIEWFDRYRAKNTGINALMIEDGDQSCKVIPVNKFNVSAKDDAPIREIMGEDFEKFFSVEYIVKLKKGALDGEIPDELSKAITANWHLLFDVKADLKVIGDLDTELQLMDPEKRCKLAEFVHQHEYRVSKS